MLYKMKKTDFCLLFLIVLSFLTKYYHSFGVNSISYGSGDAFGLILGATNLEKYPVNYLMIYVYRIFYEFTDLSLFNFTFYFTPILSAILLIFIFKILEKNVNLRVAFFSCFFIVTNPWVSYYSTEPSKALFVLLFFTTSLFFLYRYKQNKNKKDIIFSFIFLSLASIFYHSAFLFFPIYFVLVYLNICRKNNRYGIRFFFMIFFSFLIIFMIISFPFYMLKYEAEKNQSKKRVELTEIGRMSLFERYMGAMYGAIIHPEKLGYKKFLNGIHMFLVYGWAWKFFMISMIILVITYLFGFDRENLLLDFILIFLCTFVIISLQWVSLSHGSRYPQYVILFMFIVLGYFFDLILSILKRTKSKLAMVIVISLLITTSFSPMYAFRYVAGLRDIYIPQLEVKDLLKENSISIDEQHQVLYLGWPAITLALRESGVSEKYLHTFGWGNVNLGYMTSPEYIEKHNITYYIYDKTGTDYYDSAEKVLEMLGQNYKLALIDRIKVENLYVSIYKIRKIWK